MKQAFLFALAVMIALGGLAGQVPMSPSSPETLGDWAQVALPFPLLSTLDHDVTFTGPELSLSLWGDLALGEARYTLLLGVTPEGAVGLWVDRDRDERIGVGEALPGGRGEGFFAWQAELSAEPLGGSPYAYPVVILWPEGRGYVYLLGGAPRSGHSEIEGRSVVFALVDGDLDGTYGTESDFYAVDVDGDGQIHGEQGGHERFTMEEPFTIGEKSFRLAWVSPDGRTLELAEAAYVPPKVPLILGRKSPNFSFTPYGGGETLSLWDLRGKVVLLDFWATWCAPCLEELPYVKDVYQRYHDQGFEIVGISLDLDEEALRAFLEDEGITWPQYFDGRGWENEVAKLYRVQAIPATFLLDRDGVIRYRDPRGEELERAVAELISEAPEPEETLPLPAAAPEPILELALPKELGVLPGRETELSVGLMNTSAYPAEEVELSLVELPAGIVAEPARLSSIPAFGQRTAVLTLRATEEFSQDLTTELRLRYHYCQGESCFQITQGAELTLVVGEAGAAPRQPWNPWWLLGLLVVGAVGAWFLRGRRLSALFLVLLLVAGATVWAGVFLHQDRQAQQIGSVLCTSCVGIDTERHDEPTLSQATKEALKGLSRPVSLVVFHAPWCHSCPYAIALAEQFSQASPLVSLELVDAAEEPGRAEAAGILRSSHLVVPAILVEGTGEVLFGISDLEARLSESVLEAGR